MPPGISMKVIGKEKVISNLKKVPDAAARSLGGGIYLEVSNVMTDSKKEVPVDLGPLKGSGYVTPPEITENNVTVEAGYGGPAKKYAVVQHEHTEYNHPDGGKAKYLQDPMMRHKSGFSKRVADFSRRLFNSLMTKGLSGYGNHPTDPNQTATIKAMRKLSQKGGWGG